MSKVETSSILVAPFMGLLAFLVPFWFGGAETIASDNLITKIGLVYENVIFAPTAVLLFVVGLLLGRFGHRFWWLLGFLTIIIFPINAIIEMIVRPSSHNLWPIEFIFYIFMSLPAVLGAYLGNIKKGK